MALWAGQSHLARKLGESVFFDSNGDFANAGEPYVVLGQRIDEAHHEEYFPIGFSALDMRAMRGLTNTVVTSPSDTGSLDAVVANVGLSAGVLDLDRPSSEYDAISPTEQYGILQNSMLVPMYPGHQFGAFVSLAVSGAGTYFAL